MENKLHFTKVEIDNFKGIEHKIVDINGKSLFIVGKNGTHKSTFIQALLSGIDRKVLPEVTVKEGESKASTKVKLSGILNGQEEEYTLECYFTEKDQKGRLVLLNKNMEKINSPKEILKSIVGNISFDIFKFLNDKKADQIKILKELSGVSKDVDILDIERKKIYDNRTFINKKIEESEAVLNTHGLSPEEIEKFSKTIDTAPLQEELNGVSKKITTWNDVKNKTEEFSKKAIVCDEAIREYEIKIKELQQSIEATKESKAKFLEDKTKGEAWLKNNTEPNAQDTSKKLSDAMLHNEQCNKIASLVEKQKDLMKAKQDSHQMTADIQKIDDKKDKLIKNSKLPIKGLTFSDENIFLDGLPLDSQQINTATLIDIGVEISMALNPNLRVIFIHEGSLIDKDGMATLVKKCNDRGYQIIAEMVTEDNGLEIQFVER